MTVHPLHLPHAPGVLVSGLPTALGRTPDEEIVLVGTSPANRAAALILGADLDDAPWATADALLAAATADGASAVAVIVYAADAPAVRSLAAQTAAAVVFRAERRPLIVLDALWVSGGRYASYLCINPSCCPPEGSPIPEEPSTP